MKNNPMIALVLILALAGSAAAKDISRKDLKEALDKNPDLIIDAIRENKEKIFDIINEAAQEQQMRAQKERAEAEKKAFEAAFTNPFKPKILKRNHIRGDKKGDLTLVEYSDFECPYCEKGFAVVEKLREIYGKRLRFIFKHKPLSFHPQALPAAVHMEAIALQSEEKAWEFHDTLFKNQAKLGREFFEATAKELGVDMKKLKKDIEGEGLLAGIKEDIEEAESFGISGTPGFLLNGIPVRGAYPVDHFVGIVQRLDKDTAKKED